MERCAFIFPGQGAQYVLMGKDFYDEFEVAKKIFSKADELLGYSLSKIIFEGPEEVLTQTQHSQLAIYVNSIAILHVINEKFPALQPYVCAGLSLGEYTALYASGKITFEEGLLLVQKRAQFMNEACETFPGTMSAVLELDADEIQKLITPIEDVWIANCNCPKQVVISGTKEGIEKATELLKKNGAKRVLPLQVYGAFHSGLMQMAKDKLSPYIDRAKIKESKTHLIMNVVGGFVDNLSQMKENLKEQVTQPVLWEKGILSMMEHNVELFIEMGCGKTLAGMNRKIKTNGKTFSIDKVKDLQDLAAYFENLVSVG